MLETMPINLTLYGVFSPPETRHRLWYKVQHNLHAALQRLRRPPLVEWAPFPPPHLKVEWPRVAGQLLIINSERKLLQ